MSIISWLQIRTMHLGWGICMSVVSLPLFQMASPSSLEACPSWRNLAWVLRAQVSDFTLPSASPHPQWHGDRWNYSYWSEVRILHFRRRESFSLHNVTSWPGGVVWNLLLVPSNPSTGWGEITGVNNRDWKSLLTWSKTVSSPFIFLVLFLSNFLERMSENRYLKIYHANSVEENLRIDTM